MIELVGGNHAKIVRGKMLPHHGHIRSARRKPGFVLLHSQPMMVVGRILVVHLPDQFIESSFIVLF